MDELTVAFCDDDPVFRALLRDTALTALREHGYRLSCEEAGSASELALSPRLGSVDLLFLDIDMPGMDGIRFGEELRAHGLRADIIYVSNMEDKVYEIFHVHPWSFIRKSRVSEELSGVLAEYAASRPQRVGNLVLTSERGSSLSVDPADILYAEAAGKTQTLFFTDGREEHIRSSMHELEAMLTPFGFLRIHKGFLVNYRCIRRITSRSVLLDDGRDLPVGRDRLPAAREQYLALMKWKGLSKTT